MSILAYIICDGFKYIVLISENKKGHVSKVSLYYSLHGFYVVIIYLIFYPDETSNFDYPFIVLVSFGYGLMFFSKYVSHQSDKKKQVHKIKFKRKLTNLLEVSQVQSSSEIHIKPSYFYDSNNQTEPEKAMLLDDAMSLTVSNSHYVKR
jgi:hypothetical protein